MFIRLRKDADAIVGGIPMPIAMHRWLPLASLLNREPLHRSQKYWSRKGVERHRHMVDIHRRVGR